MSPHEIPFSKFEFSPSTSPDEADNESYENFTSVFSDGMEPIHIPDKLTKENYKDVLGPTLPEGLSSDIFEEGGSLELSQ